MSKPNSKSSTILILGAGSHARAVAELAAACGYPSADFLDDISPVAIAPLADLERLAPTYPAVAIAIGNLPVRQALYSRLCAIGFIVPPSSIPPPISLPRPTSQMPRSSSLTP